MKAKLTRHRKRHGDTLIVMLGVSAVIILFAIFFLEVQTMYDYQYAIEVRAQRAINSTVEFAMDDEYRADGYNYMDKQVAKDNLIPFLREDLNLNSNNECIDRNGNVLYEVEFSSIRYYSGKESRTQNAGIEMDITVTMKASLGSKFGMPEYTWTNHYASSNFRVDDGVRAGPR